MADTDFNKMLAFAAKGELSASYQDIRNILVARAKAVYGDDIDTSLDCADGIQLSNDALLIQNVLTSIGSIYENMNPTTASGKNLEVWASYNNVKRKSATKSKAYITLRNTKKSGTITINEYNAYNEIDRLALMDKNHNIWYVSDKYIDESIAAGESLSVWAEYSAYGAYEAKAGSICETVEAISGLTVEQEKDAVVGSSEESDESLRARRLSEAGSAGRSNLQAIKSALMQLDGVADVKVINNNNDFSIGQNSDSTSKWVGGNNSIVDVEPFDTTIKSHKVMIFIKPKMGDQLNRDDVAEVIWNKMTPGVATQGETLLDRMDENFASKFYTQSYYVSRSVGTDGYKSTSFSESDFNSDPESFDYPQIASTGQTGEILCNLTGVIKGKKMTSMVQNQFVFWKELKALNPALKISFIGTTNFNVGALNVSADTKGVYKITDPDNDIDESSGVSIIANRVIDHINNELGIFDNIDVDEIQSIIMDSDPYTNGKRTIKRISVAEGDGMYWDLSKYVTNDDKSEKPLNANLTNVPITQNLGSYYHYSKWTAEITKNTDNTYKVDITIC